MKSELLRGPDQPTTTILPSGWIAIACACPTQPLAQVIGATVRTLPEPLKLTSSEAEETGTGGDDLAIRLDGDGICVIVATADRGGDGAGTVEGGVQGAIGIESCNCEILAAAGTCRTCNHDFAVCRLEGHAEARCC